MSCTILSFRLLSDETEMSSGANHESIFWNHTHGKKIQHSQLEIAKISNTIILFTKFSFQLQRQRLSLHSLRIVKALSNRHHCTEPFFQGTWACVTLLGKRFCYIMFRSLRNCHCCKKVPQEAKKWVMTLILHWFYREDVWTLQ